MTLHSDSPLSQTIQLKLNQALKPSRLEIKDKSAIHAGHAGAQGGGYFEVLIVSEAFRGKSMLERHRLVYDALPGMIGQEIHALQIKAKTPEE